MPRPAQETVVAIAANGNEIVVHKHDFEMGLYPELVLKSASADSAPPKAKAKRKAKAKAR